jgi:hypothetical protein
MPLPLTPAMTVNIEWQGQYGL